jgi:hypothetical protein
MELDAVLPQTFIVGAVLASRLHSRRDIASDDDVKGGGKAGSRDVGKLRLEGKDYEVPTHFRFAN